MTTETPTDTPRVLSLSETAERLNMKRPNVAKFLRRRGVPPAFAKAQGYFWWESDIERVKAEREADKERMAADERRRQAALRNAGRATNPLPGIRLGPTQRALLVTALRRPVNATSDASRLALRRLTDRGLTEPVPGSPGTYQLTTEGATIASQL